MRDFFVSRANGIGGCHDLHEFAKYANEYQILNKIPHPTAKGVYTIEYKMYKMEKGKITTILSERDSFFKTVYDPAIWTEEKLLQGVTEAAQSAIKKGEFYRDWSGFTSEGLKIHGFHSDGKITTFWFE